MGRRTTSKIPKKSVSVSAANSSSKDMFSAQERKTCWQAKRIGNNNTDNQLVRRRTIAVWQHRWDSDNRGRWTARLIPDLKTWLARDFGEVNYYLTQFLSGHGYFNSYLYRMRKVESPNCIYCEAEDDTAEHTFFECNKWLPEREALAMQVGTFTPRTVTGKMIENITNWDRVKMFTEKILRLKKVDLDRRQLE
ncbi:uncharacterized protein LOC119665439 [Teleopsis dalmanni]|uniref:uncharacterized protein LOC119665439 n=1 Tax=Teleopsis dalmanni TaxID=139649 RepID=UPI0018CC9856|nr:uncharacterized protein LOC119665439 [Teleopsis dalmanni]